LVRAGRLIGLVAGFGARLTTGGDALGRRLGRGLATRFWAGLAAVLAAVAGRRDFEVFRVAGMR
jgi:hypothetical protein